MKRKTFVVFRTTNLWFAFDAYNRFKHFGFDKEFNSRRFIIQELKKQFPTCKTISIDEYYYNYVKYHEFIF